ncbi:MAG: hypothetical protein M3361_14505, partial [Candidatus Tectomicrobia bacterium]|nr:hypothetical protein [Candidatus Tectomicrobia bacterium]
MHAGKDGGVNLVRFRREAEGQFFLVEPDFEEDIFDATRVIIFQRNPLGAVLHQQLLDLRDGSLGWNVRGIVLNQFLHSLKADVNSR